MNNIIVNAENYKYNAFLYALTLINIQNHISNVSLH